MNRVLVEVERSLKSVVKTKKFMIDENIKRVFIYRKRLTLIMQMVYSKKPRKICDAWLKYIVFLITLQ